MTQLNSQVALVTGASRGVGRGVALGLAAAGVRVFATGRTIATVDLGPDVTRIPCDHTGDAAVAQVFREIQETAGRLDILVNAAWGGYERMVEDGKVHLHRSLLGAARLALGGHDDGRCSSGIHCQPARGTIDGSRERRPHRAHLILGCPEAHCQHALRNIQSGDRQNGRGHGP